MEQKEIIIGRKFMDSPGHVRVNTTCFTLIRPVQLSDRPENIANRPKSAQKFFMSLMPTAQVNIVFIPSRIYFYIHRRNATVKNHTLKYFSNTKMKRNGIYAYLYNTRHGNSCITMAFPYTAYETVSQAPSFSLSLHIRRYCYV